MRIRRAFVILIGVAGLVIAFNAAAVEMPKEGRDVLQERLLSARDQLGAKETRASGEAELQRVVDELRKQVEKLPNEAWPHLLLGRAQLYLRNKDEALKELDSAGKLAPDDAEVTFYQGYLHRVTGDVAGAKALLERAVTLAPENPLPLEDLGELLMDQKQPEKALPYLTKACALPGASALAFFLLASAQRALEKYDEALVNYEKAAEMDPEEAEPHFYAGTELQLRGEFKRALPHFEALAKLDAENPMVWTKLVQIYQSVGDSKHRDEARAKVLAMYQAGEFKRKEFGREMFPAAEYWVYAVEVLEPKPPFNAQYQFIVFANSRSDRPVVIFSLESADADQAFAKETGRLKPGERVYTLDSVVPGKSHATHEFFHRKPSYEDVRGLVIEALKGESAPLSSTTMEKVPEKSKDSEKPVKKAPGKPAETH